MKQACLAILLGSFIAGWAQAETVEGRSAELKAAIMKANQALILAVRSGDAEPLALHFSGEALAPLSLSIKRARAVNRYSVSELLDTAWGEIQEQDERAEVEVAEKWQHTVYAAGTDKCLFKVAARVVRQTYRLAKTPGGWVITDVVDDPKNEPAKMAACR